MLHYYNEIEPFCCAVLRTQIDRGNLPKGYVDQRDVKLVTSEELSEYRQVHLFAGIGGFAAGFHEARFPDDIRICTAGFPCQDLSVAGKRAGLEGSRSGLFWEVVRILGELRPAWFVLENVPGLFSSGEGRDFATVLNALDELGYGVAWRVLNSQFFGVAQRRRRVFIVGRFGKPCPAEVLFEPEGGGGDFAESGETGQDIAVPLTSGIGRVGRPSGRRLEDDFNLAVAENCRGELRNMDIMPALSTGGGKPGVGYPCVQVAAQISASAGHHGHSSPRGDGSDNIIVTPTLHAGMGHHGWSCGDQDFEQLQPVCIQDARGQRDKRQNGIGIQEGGPMYTLDGTSQHAVGCNLEHQERASKLGRDPRRDDEHNGRTDDERAPADSYRVRDFAELPQGLDSSRYRALGNAVTRKVAAWVGKRIKLLACEGATKL